MFENIIRNADLFWKAAAILGFFIVVIVDFICRGVLPFKDKRDYIMMEIKRTEGREHIYWKNKLKRLYLESFPIVGKIICKFIK